MSEKRLYKRLPPAPRARILAYIDDPSFDVWQAIRDTMVAPGVTLFDMVETVDRDFSWFGSFYPSGILVARASDCVEKRYEDLEAFDIFPPVA